MATTITLVIANHEIINWFQKQGVTRTHDMHIGGSHHFEFGNPKLTVAHHGSMLSDGSYARRSSFPTITIRFP